MLLAFILPAALGLCCCLPEALADDTPAPSCHKQHADEAGQNSRDECRHDQVTGSPAQEAPAAAQTPAFNLASRVPAEFSFETSVAPAGLGFFDTGPPDSAVSLPIYLKISVFRI